MFVYGVLAGILATLFFVLGAAMALGLMFDRLHNHYSSPQAPRSTGNPISRLFSPVKTKPKVYSDQRAFELEKEGM